MGGAQLLFQFEHRIIGKNPHIQIDNFRFRMPCALKAVPPTATIVWWIRRAELLGSLESTGG